jgi:cell division protein FtsL
MALAKTIRVRGNSTLERVVFSTRFLVVIILVMVLAIAYITIKVEAIRMGYEISASKREEEKSLKENLLLTAELMRLKSPQRVEGLAHELGFKFPTQEDLIYIEENTLIGESK